jgi:hypothetical protein
MNRHSLIDQTAVDPRYSLASSTLEAILKHDVPSGSTLNALFGNLAPAIGSLLEKYLKGRPDQKLRVRRHHKDPSVITQARIRLENNLDYANLQSLILSDELPQLRDIEPIYGDYSQTVQNVLSIYRKFRLKRICGIPAAAHPSRVGGLVSTLGFDTAGSFKYSTIAFLHDCIEDLIPFEKQRTADHYGLRGLQQFIDDNVPTDLQSSVALLTNHYALILNYLNYLLKLSDTPATKSNLLRSIDSLRSWEWSLNGTVKHLSTLLSATEIDEPALPNAKWQCYKDLYIREMADNALVLSDFRTFEIKAIDLCDNAHGGAALSLSDKQKNIIKLGIWATQGYRLHTNWAPTNNFIQELFEDALVYSEQLVIKDFLEPASKLDFFASALLKIEELKSIFYVEEG